MPAQSFNNHDFLIIILYAGIGLGLKCTLVELLHFPLSALHSNSLMLLLEFGTDPVLICAIVAVAADHTGHTLVHLRVLGVGLRLEGQFLVLLAAVLLLPGFELVLCHRVSEGTVCVLLPCFVHYGFRRFVYLRLEGHVTVYFLLL